MTTEYRIEYQITRRRVGEDDFTEVGFGSTGASESVNDAAYELESAIQNRLWGNEPHQPSADDLEATS